MKAAYRRLFGEAAPAGEMEGMEGMDSLAELELKELAGNIVEAQSKEIEDMDDWREKWYGAPSPAGGVPDE